MSQDPWAGLPVDPTLPEHAHLRAGDRDRDAVAQVLADAYAEGRMDRDELDQRAEALAGARTLGELPPLVSDLVAPSAGTGLARTGARSPDTARVRAVEKYEHERRRAWWSMLTATLICTVIWVAGGMGSDWSFDPAFPWPLFVLLGTGLNYGRTVFDREDMVAEEVRRLERKARRREARKLGPGPEQSPDEDA
ncbi:DUF1707 SHOCT-like domain-containing protein [Nocardioides campestrisoli]|uniref:DUF1707 SHOCT-like domain-containing protein n=1 Tax=Nocardioides campestrisoli TaxID=2736757 RepID=UPI00163DE31B|nr:DUF1707 domain-containing protein [Nocardioides campestrisoli]